LSVAQVYEKPISLCAAIRAFFATDARPHRFRGISKSLKNGSQIFDAYEPREVGRVLRLDKKKAPKTQKTGNAYRSQSCRACVSAWPLTPLPPLPKEQGTSRFAARRGWPLRGLRRPVPARSAIFLSSEGFATRYARVAVRKKGMGSRAGQDLKNRNVTGM
jgi:hypothetical protein